MNEDNPILQSPEPQTDANGNPTPDERADFVLKRIEQFIREGRKLDEGMSLRQWEEMAKMEIANALIDAENCRLEDNVVTHRFVVSMAAALVTVGFWGTLVAFDKADYLLTAIISSIAGFWLFAIAVEWRVRKHWKKHQAGKRMKALGRVEDLTRRIRRLERELEEEEKGLKKEAGKDITGALRKILSGGGAAAGTANLGPDGMTPWRNTGSD